MEENRICWTKLVRDIIVPLTGININAAFIHDATLTSRHKALNTDGDNIFIVIEKERLFDPKSKRDYLDHLIELRKMKNYVTEYDLKDRRFLVVVLKIDKSFIEDYHLILQGNYTMVSEPAKKRILAYLRFLKDKVSIGGTELKVLEYYTLGFYDVKLLQTYLLLRLATNDKLEVASALKVAGQGISRLNKEFEENRLKNYEI